ncbi:heme-binding protein [Prosthecochloris sp. GSB1]|uniref:SOUL family heme-binding protein n=1 Tax=Prosthecochloris sp. GSB1 TaxID=281093 RepID=UPI000B8C84BD|nr:heme-binding protein [Prosthecochloris sp. GSB1]ASQ91409.1 heme-binding protein [Prosthecochloris sp. GSB1]
MQTLLLLMFSSLLLAGCSVFGKRTAPEPPYIVLQRDGVFEVRRYEPMIVAQAVLDGSYRSTSGKAFGKLSGYIFGSNRSNTEIGMTSPVLQERAGEKIGMTAPVIQEKEGDAWAMSFVLPPEYTLENAPEPQDADVVLREIPGARVAVIRFSGLHAEKNIEKHAGRLLLWLNRQGYRVLSPPRAASYDPPWTIPFLRRNEVMITIE